MTALEEEIGRNYGRRGGKDHLYAGGYAQRAFEERRGIMAKFFTEHRQSGDDILEIGAGHGDNVRIMRDGGFSDAHIYLNELLPERAVNIRTRYPAVHCLEGNALALPDAQYAWIFQSTVFTSIPGDDDRRRLADRMWQLLKPGGYLVWYDFIFNNPSNKDVRAVTPREVRSLFRHGNEVMMRKVTLAPPVGRRIGRLYNVFNLPFLRSHILAVFQKPR